MTDHIESPPQGADSPAGQNEPAVVPPEPALLAEADALRDKIAALRKEVAGAEDRWKRALADFDNYRKRVAREMDAVREAERQRAAAALLPLVDGLERAIEYASTADDALMHGLTALHDQAVSALAQLGYPLITAEGATFDPRLHEAISITHDPEAAPNTIVAVVRTGYGTAERTLRPAGVVVARPGEE